MSSNLSSFPSSSAEQQVNPHPFVKSVRNWDSEWIRTTCSRRHVLQAGGTGLLGLSLPKLSLAQKSSGHPKPKAKSVIFLFQFGGPSHVDTFDMKPNAPDGVRSKYQQIETTMPGLRICEHLPETAKVMDKVTLVHTVHHTMKNHNPASYYAITGHAPPLDDIRLRDTLDLYPAYGSVVDALAPGGAELPSFVAFPHVIRDGAITPGQHASFLGKGHDPLLITEDPNSNQFRLPQLSLPANLSVKRLNRREELLKLVDAQNHLSEQSNIAKGWDLYFEKTFRMLNSPKVKQAFDLSQESDTLREQYGRTTYGQSCLLARRLVEAGVKFVNVYFSRSIGGRSKTSGGWDTHGFDNTRMYEILPAWHFPVTDRTLPVFLNDMDERGLLEETLVVWMGEFGRTPKINGNISRDHWPQCYTVLLAGGRNQTRLPIRSFR